MKRIPVDNEVALISNADFDYISQFKWHLSNSGYAMTQIKRKTCYMHRMVANTPTDMDTDHKNANRLDNRRSNLRICTRSQNLKFKKAYSRSGYKYVYFDDSRNAGTPWKAQIGKKTVGRFKTALAAHKHLVALRGEL